MGEHRQLGRQPGGGDVRPRARHVAAAPAHVPPSVGGATGYVGDAGGWVVSDHWLLDPATRSTRSIEPRPGDPAKTGAAAVWTGSEILSWGGLGNDQLPRATGAAYRPPAARRGAARPVPTTRPHQPSRTRARQRTGCPSTWPASRRWTDRAPGAGPTGQAAWCGSTPSTTGRDRPTAAGRGAGSSRSSTEVGRGLTGATRRGHVHPGPRRGARTAGAGAGARPRGRPPQRRRRLGVRVG